MTEEFNLSNKIGKACKYIEDEKVIHIIVVKQFIELIKEGYQKIHPDRLHLDVIPMIKKLAGDELK